MSNAWILNDWDWIPGLATHEIEVRHNRRFLCSVSVRASDGIIWLSPPNSYTDYNSAEFRLMGKVFREAAELSDEVKAA